MNNEQVDLVLDNLEDLKEFELVNNQTLTQDPQYKHYLKNAYKHYKKLSEKEDIQWRPYQPEYAALYATRRKNICALTMGLGKTTIAGLMLCCLYDESIQSMRAGSIQIIAPSELSIKVRWLEDLQKLDAISDNIDFLKKKEDVFKANKPIWIYNQDFPKRELPNKKGNNRFLSKVLNRANVLIVDEAHHLKPKTQRSRHINYLAKRSKRVLLMSGTISDGRLDLINFLNELTYGKLWPYNEKDFKKKFTAKKKVKSSYLYGMNSNDSKKSIHQLSPDMVSKYSKLIQCYVHRASYSDSNIYPYVHIPERETVVDIVTPSKEHSEHYEKTLKDKQTDLEQAKLYNKSKMKAKALQLLHPVLLASNCPPYHIENVKLEKLKEYVKEYQRAGKKTAVFCDGVEAARVTTLSLLEEKFKTERLYAYDPNYEPNSQTPAMRSKVVNKFLFTDEVEVGVFSVNLASESIDLTTADQVIFYDYPWASLKLQQALFRVIRPGNKSDKVRAVYLGNKGFIDEHQQTLLAEKINSANLMLDFDTTALEEVNNDFIDLSSVVENVIS